MRKEGEGMIKLPGYEGGLIYLASPYSHPDSAVLEERVRLVSIAAARMFEAGYNVFSPIAHTHTIAVNGGLAGHFDRWAAYDTLMIGLSERLAVLRLSGWAESKGGDAEIKLALKQSKPIDFIFPEMVGL